MSLFNNKGNSVKNDKKIGIIGYWFATNYGGVASYYSLYQKIAEMGYFPYLIENPYFSVDKEGTDVFSRNFFIDHNVQIAQPYDNQNLEKLNDLGDTFLLGSDQVLTTSSIRAFGKLFLMEFALDSKKRIAYSASCGGDNLDGQPELIAYAKEQLKKFSAISVREYSATEILKNKFGIITETMIDPIFFLSAKDYRKLEAKSLFNRNKDYVLAYILDPTDDKKNVIEMVSETLGLPIEIALDGRKFTHNTNLNKMGMPNETLPELNEGEWINRISNASYIVTDSFHGAAMALIMNKPFIMYANYGRGYPRFVTLAKMFNVKERLIENSQQLSREIINKEIDFDAINKRIEQETRKASDWIEFSLKYNKSAQSVDAFLDIKEKCVGCGSCVNICPVDAIELKENKFGYYKATINKNKCIGCSKCSKVCPALELPDNNNFAPQAFAFVNKDQKSLMKSTSGGAFVALAKEVLNSGGVVYGVAYTNELYTIHKRIDSVDDLPLLQKSKYMQSFIGKDILRQVKLDICSGKKVLFSGCPCQIAGLKKYLGTEYDNLFLVDLFCTCNPSAKIMQKYIRENCHTQNGNITSFEFRHKDLNDTEWSGSTISYVSDGEEHYLKLGPTSFYSNLFILAPSHCEKCKYQGVPRQADISLGDAWGIANYDNSLDRRYGVSAVLVNSAKGQKLWNRLCKGEYIIKEEKVENICKYNGISFTKTRDWPTENYRELFYDNVLINGFNIAYRKAFAKFKETHNRIGVVAFGSCSCDAVRYSKNYDVLNAIQDNLFENIITSSVDLDKYDAFYNSESSANEKLNAYYNYDKPLCSKLFQKNAEYLILDLADERWRTLKLIDAKNNSHYLYYPFNNENEKYKSIIDKTNVLNGFKTMVFSLNQSDYMIIRERYKRAVDALLRHFNPSKIIVLDVRMAHQYLLNNGKLKTYNHDFWNIDAANEHLNKLYEILYELLPNSPSIKMPEYTIGQENHLFGASPLHFQDSYYEYVCTAINIIAGKDQTHTIQQLYNEQSLKNRINYDTITSQTKIEDLIRRIESIEKNMR